MPNLVQLDAVDHHDLRLAAAYGAAFGHAVNQLLVVPDEFEEVQRDYPILFREDSDGAFIAIALLGFDRGENLFLDGPRWAARYVPATARAGPFSLRMVDEDAASPRLATFIDLDDPRVGDNEGEPLFKQHGGNAPALEEANFALHTVQDGIGVSRIMFSVFSEIGLLQPVNLNIELGDGLTYTIPKMFTIGNEALRNLGAEALSHLHKSGFLPHAVFARSSLPNMRRLIELKTAKLANG
jgi:hypothetical protein